MNIYPDGKLPELTEKECRDCQETKSIQQFRLTPTGIRSAVCASCAGKKAAATVAAGRAVRADSAAEEASKPWIIDELVKQYKKAKSTSEKIRCLETLTKLQPQDAKTQLDDPAVIASLIESKKAKLQAEKAKASEVGG